jgi:hypothetical protein
MIVSLGGRQGWPIIIDTEAASYADAREPLMAW